MNRRCAPAIVVAALLLACDKPGGDTPGGGAAAASASAPASALLQPFQGAWKFDLEKTLALWKAEGVPATQISQARAASGIAPLHEDMTVAGNTAVISSSASNPLEGEYAFFAMHPHGQWVCGKAWHHEDRQDPGDMTKCYARLELRNNGAELHLSVKMEQTVVNANDPDITTMPPTAGSAADCVADAAAGPAWSPWSTYVFVPQGK